MILVVTALASATSRRTVESLATERIADQILTDDLLLACSSAIRQFLNDNAAKQVLGPDVDRAEVQVIQETLFADERPTHISIVAVDQCACLPLDLVRAGSPLRLAIPVELQPQLDRLIELDSKSPGFDAIINPSEPSPFTQPGARPALCHFVRLHGSGSVRVNVNTAPRALLEAVFRELGRGGLDAILQARADGKSAIVPAGEGRKTGDRPRLNLATASDCWAFRIDIQVQSARRSWWEVYRRGAEGWQPLQRCCIND